jgi:adenosylmethionine-8-amino-7-oxononanoate aminotransferase
MATREELIDWDREHHWHAFTQMAHYEPLVIARAEGCYLYDVDGRKYLDGAASMWCNVHGHRHPRINAAIRDQLGRVAHATSLGMGCDTTARLAKRLADLAPGGLSRVFFSSDGSSAVEVALKMAFQYWRQCENPRPEKTKFIALSEAYHGDTLGAASVGGIPRFHALFEPLLFEVIRAPMPAMAIDKETRRQGDKGSGIDSGSPGLLFSRPPCLAAPSGQLAHLKRLEELLEAHHEEAAALVIEPLVQCAAGMVMHPEGYLRGVRELTKRYDVLLIADEIAVGMGRTGTMFACEQEQVVADFLCLGKGLTGGYLPLAATITNERIYSAFLGDPLSGRTLHHGHTYSGNPLAAAAALATLDIFEMEQTLANLPAKAQRLGEHLCRLAEHPRIMNTRQRGLIAALELSPDKRTQTPYGPNERIAWRVCREALRRGVWLRPLGDVLYVMPPLSIDFGEIDMLMNTLAGSIDEVLCRLKQRS